LLAGKALYSEIAAVRELFCYDWRHLALGRAIVTF
jgi:hypothetical protein